jgi:predicted DNA binding CopG/RHH family protein
MSEQKEPGRTIRYIDDEESELVAAIEAEGHIPGKSLMKPGEVQEFSRMASRTINGERAKITIRIPLSDLAKLKARALREGMPYQTLIGSILHKAVS